MAQGRRALLDQLMAAAPQLVMDGLGFHSAVAERLGLSLTDLRYLNVIANAGPLTAGELAGHSGLTTGAVTRLVDRLVRDGFVRRSHDTQDRRRVIIEAVPERMAAVGPMYEGMAGAWREVLDRYDEEQLRTILDLFTRMREVSRREADQVRSAS